MDSSAPPVSCPAHPTLIHRTDSQVIEDTIGTRLQQIVEHQEAITRIHDEIAALKLRRNATLPISKLPTEVLSEIFLLVLSSIFNKGYDDDYWSQSPNSWLSVLHVCHAWREVAYHLPRLWTFIVPSHPLLVQTALKLSQNLPIAIVRHGRSWYNTIESYTFIFAEFFRIRQVYLRITRQVWNLLSDSKELLLRAPLLEDISIDLTATNTSPFSFSTMDLPRLTSLRATFEHGTYRILRTLIRPTLTSLSLWHYDSNPIQLMDVLKSLPALQNLDLHYHKYILEPTPQNILPPPIRTVTMPALKLLNIAAHDSGISSAYLLDHFVDSPNMELRFSTQLPCRTAAEYAMVLGSVKSNFLRRLEASNPTAYIRSVRLCTAYEDLQITLYDTAQSLEEQAWCTREQGGILVLYISLKLGNDGRVSAFKFLTGLNISHVKALYIDSLPIPSRSWLGRLQDMSKVEYLGLRGMAAYSFFTAMALSKDNSTVFPALKVLQLREFTYTEPSRSDANVIFVQFINKLSLRRAMGYGLKRLELAGSCQLTEDDYNAFLNGRIAEQVVRIDGDEF